MPADVKAVHDKLKKYAATAQIAVEADTAVEAKVHSSHQEAFMKMGLVPKGSRRAVGNGTRAFSFHSDKGISIKKLGAFLHAHSYRKRADAVVSHVKEGVKHIVHFFFNHNSGHSMVVHTAKGRVLSVEHHVPVSDKKLKLPHKKEKLLKGKPSDIGFNGKKIKKKKLIVPVVKKKTHLKHKKHK